ncbi:aminotransferase class V-fold PLP-dependent enzyme [Actinophytocola xanthii]|uniref:Aminotransferase class V domain-containing protein n=1 Tax=Actinophytocola xanthii TaxID=1912961 RepID=A0A1Q8CDV0_9PSEU|nr:aminotransferase class V-fold PLP-dependent enzyme [Actinophytocola xanthii]OLF12554.1 hypothetical protein BU204_29050 [Actinophytocola xanthii]
MDEHSRRTLLAAGLLAGVGTVAACTGTPDAEPSAARRRDEFDPADWESVRAQFALDPELVHLAAYVFAAHPRPVREAVERHRTGMDRDAEHYVQQNVRAEDDVRAAAATYLNTSAERIALTDSTTMGLGLLYSGLRLRRGQEILTTEHDFVATHEAVRLAGRRTGAAVRRVRLYDRPEDADAAEIVRRLRAAIRPATRVIAVTWVHSGTGVRLPLAEIGQAVAAANAGRAPADRALLCVDGVHGFGAVDADIDDLGCDFLATGTHKWLFGPRGTGLLWGRSWDALDALIPTFSGGETPGAAYTPGGYHTFEHRWALREAFEFHQAIGRRRIAAQITEQASRLKEGLARIDSVRLVTPRSPDLSAGIVCCAVESMDAFSASAALRESHGISASVTPYAEQFLRFGPSIVTTPEQIDRTLDAVEALG